MRMKYGYTIIASIMLLLVGASFYSRVIAQTTSTSSQQKEDEKNQLQQQLQDIENQIAQYEQQLSAIKGEKNTLQNKVKQLQNQQAALTLQIEAANLQIDNLETEMSRTQLEIDKKTETIADLKNQLAQFIVLLHQQDAHSIVYALVTNDKLSDAFDEIQNETKITEGLNRLVGETRAAQEELVQQKANLAGQQDEVQNIVAVKALQQQQLVGSVTEQSSLLKQTKGKESSYQAVLSDTQKQAAQIRNRLYDLLGGGKQVTFGEAVSIAQSVSAQTGVRAAFLLAVLTQESSLGKNVGTCNRVGDPPEKSWKVVMKPDRDQKPFLQITSDLGLNPEITPVSCPMKDAKGAQLGWGGAMGPAQFIPSTWVGYAAKVSKITGKTANPWDIRDAFIAAALKLGADGATSQAGEWAAAMRYFSGGTNQKYAFYGNSVVAQAEKYQRDVDMLSK